MSNPLPHGSSEPATGHSHDPHAVPHDAAHFHNHAKLYLIVGLALMVCTAITVGLSYVDFGSTTANINVAIALAGFKASLVALIFMHLKEEKKSIYQFLFATVIFVLGLFLLSVLAFKDPISL